MGYKMKVYAISDLHLSNSCDKPMDIFGGNWENYTSKIIDNWSKSVKQDDIVLVAGDISWAMKLEEAVSDLNWIDALPGTKILIKGNHEYWWKSISSVRQILPQSIKAIQNDAIKIGKFIFCGTRGWNVPDENNKDFSDEDMKIFKREVERLKLTLIKFRFCSFLSCLAKSFLIFFFERPAVKLVFLNISRYSCECCLANT